MSRRWLPGSVCAHAEGRTTTRIIYLIISLKVSGEIPSGQSVLRAADPPGSAANIETWQLTSGVKTLTNSQTASVHDFQNKTAGSGSLLELIGRKVVAFNLNTGKALTPILF